MPVPKRKRSKARRDSRFANKGIEIKAITQCNNCTKPLQPHAACIRCGFYKGVKVLTTKYDRGVSRSQIRAKKAVKQTKTQSGEHSE